MEENSCVHNIDRDSALKYFADMLTAFSEVATIQNYNNKQTNADRIGVHSWNCQNVRRGCPMQTN